MPNINLVFKSNKIIFYQCKVCFDVKNSNEIEMSKKFQIFIFLILVILIFISVNIELIIEKMKSKLSKKLTKKLDPKDLSFIKTYGELHPINDLEYVILSYFTSQIFDISLYFFA